MPYKTPSAVCCVFCKYEVTNLILYYSLILHPIDELDKHQQELNLYRKHLFSLVYYAWHYRVLLHKY